MNTTPTWATCWDCDAPALPFSIWCVEHNDETEDERNARRERVERLMKVRT